MFSQACIIPSVRGGGGKCVAKVGGMYGEGSMCDKLEHAWQRGGGMHGEGGMCGEGGMHGEGGAW